MTEDLKTFIDQHEIEQPILLGHSMGGKAVMNTALQCPDLISKLIVVDMPPVAMKLARNFGNYVTAMKAIEEAKPSKQSEADKILSQYESNVGVRMFLLTNLKRMSDGALRFRIPYDILGNSLDNIGGFHVPENAVYKGETLFIAGGESPYLRPFHDKEKQIKQMFPNSKLEVVAGAGHWGKFSFFLLLIQVALNIIYFSSCGETRRCIEFNHIICIRIKSSSSIKKNLLDDSSIDS